MTRPTGWKSYDAIADEYDQATRALFERLARELVGLVAPAPGSAVLDVGTGTGPAARAAAAAVGGDGIVAGVDPSIAMLDLARSRGVKVVAGVVPGLPFPPEVFDAAVANLVLSHFADLGGAIGDIVRVLRPGSMVGATAWAEVQSGPDDRGEEAFMTVTRVVEEFGLPVEPPEAAVPFEEWLRVPDNLRSAFNDVGLRDVMTEERAWPVHASASAWLAWTQWGARCRYVRAVSDEATWERLRVAALDALERRFPDGVPRVARLRLVVGTKAG
ncbi:MAG: methyltransferase domain-containing protein [Actinomycetota bacterium]